MEKYKLQVKGNKNGGVHSFYIEVQINESNFKQYGGFAQWIGNSNYKKDVSSWLATQCPGYSDLTCQIQRY